MKKGRVDINNSTNSRISVSFLKKVAEEVLKKENKIGCDLSVILVDEKTIKRINREYKKENKATDVLSFNYLEKNSFPGNKLLGEIVICPSQSGKKEKNVAEVLIHGILHLSGYDHEKNEKMKKEMENKEKEYRSFIADLF